MTISVEPKRNPPQSNEIVYKVYERVREALFALPTYFQSDTSIEGILATDIFTLNAAFGATIEDQVVSTLNRMREVWDPDEQFMYYRFVRQPQTFPDVLLRKDTSGTDRHESEILLGIELKSWYLLAKEGEPSFRFQVTPAACAKQDLNRSNPLGSQQCDLRLSQNIFTLCGTSEVRVRISKLLVGMYSENKVERRNHDRGKCFSVSPKKR